mgnify:CR=1 FL=1
MLMFEGALVPRRSDPPVYLVSQQRLSNWALIEIPPVLCLQFPSSQDTETCQDLSQGRCIRGCYYGIPRCRSSRVGRFVGWPQCPEMRWTSD